MAKRRVPLYKTSPVKSVLIDPEATVGARVGVDLLGPDGKLVTPAMWKAMQGGGSESNASGGTTDGVEEGRYNLYFTDERAQDAVGGLLKDSANVTLTYDDNGPGIKADLTDLTDTNTGTLQAITRDAKGRVTGTTDATITGTDGRVTVANGNASAGVPTIDLAQVPDAGGGSLLKIVRDLWGRIAGTSTPDTGDLPEGSNLYYTDARADGRITHAKGQTDGIASLQGGKLDPGQLPALAITETFVVNTEAAMLALDCQQGDVAVRTDLSKSFILTTEPASTLANWQELLNPTGGVSSFNGRTGSVTPASGDYTFAQIGSKPTTLAGYGITDAATATQGAKADAAEPGIAPGASTQYWRGDKTWRDFATDVRAALLAGLSTTTSAVIAATDTVLSALGKLQAQVSLKMDDAVPSARADANASQSIPSGAFQKVLLGSEIFDVGGIYNPATSKFTPTKAGKYMAIGSASLSPAVAAGSRVIAAVAKNGTVVENVTSPATSSPTNNVQHCLAFDMNGTTDYLELYARQDSGTTINVLGNAGTNMVVFRVGA